MVQHGHNRLAFLLLFRKFCSVRIVNNHVEITYGKTANTYILALKGVCPTLNFIIAHIDNNYHSNECCV